MIDKLGERESREILQNHQFGHLGCHIAGEPYVIPISYWCDAKYIYSHSLPGRKIKAMREHPIVCIQVETIQDAYNWQSVIAVGAYEEITDSEERKETLSQLFQRFPKLTPVESRMNQDLSELIVFRIEIEKITGVYEKVA